MTERDAELAAAAATAVEVGRFGSIYNEDEIFNLTELSSDKGFGCASYARARWYLCGVERAIDREKATHFYRLAREQGCGCSVREAAFNGSIDPIAGAFRGGELGAEQTFCATILAHSVRYAFGFDEDQFSVHKARDTAALFQIKGMRRCSHREAADAFKSIVLPSLEFLSLFSKFFEERITLPCYLDDDELDALWLWCSKYKLQALVTFCALSQIASDDGWRNCNRWRRRVVLSEIELRGISFGDLSASQRAIGIPQNVMSATGIPKPGRYVAPKHQDQFWFTHLDGFDFGTKGDTIEYIMPVGRRLEGAPALMMGDDFIVALCLAFCQSQRQAEATGISLEQPPAGDIPPGISALMYKLFTPRWLAATHFGGSFFWADFMAGRYDSGTGLTSFSDPLKVDVSDEANNVRGYFERYSPAHPSTGSDATRICLKLYDVKVSTSKRRSGFLRRRTECQMRFAEIGFRIDGSGMNWIDSGRTAVYENDPNKPEAHSGLSLTNRLGKIEKVFPVFRRVKYLLALTRTLTELRKSGLELSPHMRAELNETVRILDNKAESTCLYMAA